MLAGLLLLLLVLAVLAAVLSALVIYLMARGLLRPPRMEDGKAVWLLKRLSPGDLGLAFEDVSFNVRDEQTGETLRIAAWWIPHPDDAAAAAAAGRCAVLVHGYADAKVGAIAWAPTWHALGYHLLVPDLRAHGESGGKICTGGYFERHDLNAVLNLLRAERPDHTRELALFGVSMGAAVAVAAAAERARAGLNDVAALVLESPFADYAVAAMTHMDHLGLPGRRFQRAAVALAQRLSGADFAAVRPVDLLAQVHCPVLVIRSADDPFLPPADAAAFEAALNALSEASGPAEFWRAEAAAHLMALANGPEEYRRRVGEFLGRARAAGNRSSEKAADPSPRGVLS